MTLTHLRLSVFFFPFVAAAAALAGCLPASTSPMDGGGDVAVAVTYTHDAQPIFMAKCSPCHAGQTLGGHNIATTYSDALTLVTSVDAPMGCWGGMDPTTGMLTMPKKVGECALIAINAGWMPMGAGCASTPPLTPDACLTTDQKAVIAAWVAAGLPQ